MISWPRLSPERARELFDYDPATGALTWRRRADSEKDAARLNSRHAGKVAGNLDRLGYLKVFADGRQHKAHRVVWLIVNGELGDAQIDHINCNRSDNRIENLRLASRSQNIANSRRHSDASSGYKGVTWHPSGKWHARIKQNGRSRSLGLFADPAEAHAAYCTAASKAFGEFARFA